MVTRRRRIYPHAHNDCLACGDRDADVAVLASDGTTLRELCQECLGQYFAWLVLSQAGDDRSAVTSVDLALASGRRP